MLYIGAILSRFSGGGRWNRNASLQTPVISGQVFNSGSRSSFKLQRGRKQKRPKDVNADSHRGDG